MRRWRDTLSACDRDVHELENEEQGESESELAEGRANADKDMNVSNIATKIPQRKCETESGVEQR